MRVGIADHFGWAVAVTADGERVVDRRRIELVEPGLTSAPVHYTRKRLDAAATADLVAAVRASAARCATAAFGAIQDALDEPVVSVSLRTWPADVPTDVEVLREPSWESRADAIMYRQVLAEVAGARGWEVHRYDRRDVVDRAATLLGDRAEEVLQGPRAALGPPWAKDHRTALAAAIVAGAGARPAPEGDTGSRSRERAGTRITLSRYREPGGRVRSSGDTNRSTGTAEPLLPAAGPSSGPPPSGPGDAISVRGAGHAACRGEGTGGLPCVRDSR